MTGTVRCPRQNTGAEACFCRPAVCLPGSIHVEAYNGIFVCQNMVKAWQLLFLLKGSSVCRASRLSELPTMASSNTLKAAAGDARADKPVFSVACQYDVEDERAMFINVKPAICG